MKKQNKKYFRIILSLALVCIIIESGTIAISFADSSVNRNIYMSEVSDPFEELNEKLREELEKLNKDSENMEKAFEELNKKFENTSDEINKTKTKPLDEFINGEKPNEDKNSEKDNKQNETTENESDESDESNESNVLDSNSSLFNKVIKVIVGQKSINVDGKNYEMDVAPYIQSGSGSTMVPLRFVMIALGIDNDNIGLFDESQKVNYDYNTKTATIFYISGTNMTTIQFTAGSNIMDVNGVSIPMENGVKAEIVKGRMFVPFRAIGTALGVNVSWDSVARAATYN